MARAARLRGARIVTDMVTVTGTENLMMAATLADGETVIENAAREPEVVDLALALNAMGARIEGAGTDRIVVHGVRALHGGAHRVMPDRIEAGTFLCAVAATGGDVMLTRAAPDVARRDARQAARGRAAHRGRPRLGARNDGRGGRGPSTCAPRRIRASRPTCRRRSWRSTASPRAPAVITETIFENRFMHVQELRPPGRRHRHRGQHRGRARRAAASSGATVMATDLRASAGLVIAGLVAEGETLIDRIYHLDRGYDRWSASSPRSAPSVERVKRGARRP